MNIGIEGDDDKCYVVVQFSSGERAVKGPMPEAEAQAWIDGITDEMKEEGFGGAIPRGHRGGQLPQVAMVIGSVTTFLLLVWLLTWVLGR